MSCEPWRNIIQSDKYQGLRTVLNKSQWLLLWQRKETGKHSVYKKKYKRDDNAEQNGRKQPSKRCEPEQREPREKHTCVGSCWTWRRPVVSVLFWPRPHPVTWRFSQGRAGPEDGLLPCRALRSSPELELWVTVLSLLLEEVTPSKARGRTVTLLEWGFGWGWASTACKALESAMHPSLTLSCEHEWKGHPGAPAGGKTRTDVKMAWNLNVLPCPTTHKSTRRGLPGFSCWGTTSVPPLADNSAPQTQRRP